MRRFAMKQKWLSWGDDYTIRDARGSEVYYVDGKVFTLRDRLSFQDMEGNELALISKKLLAWGPTYEIYRGGDLAALVRKAVFTLFHCRFTVDVPGPDDLEATGSFFDYEYLFSKGDHTVATVSKKFFSMTDSYGIEMADDQDPILVLAAAVVIDRCCHEEKD